QTLCETELEMKAVKSVESQKATDNEFPLLLRPVSEWNIFELVDRPGLLFVENPWTEAGVRYWVCRSLLQLTQAPSKLNIDGPLSSSWWEEAQRCLPHDKGAMLRRLRWATFGYHHDWHTKEYSEQNKCPFPGDVAAVCRYVAEAVGGWSEFAAQAAILNFYHADSTLSGHCDRSEPNMQAPLLSFSFGQSAIFLAGGRTLDEKPSAVFIDNGDVMIMSAASRHVYHAVPRIVTSRWSPAAVGGCGTQLQLCSTNASLDEGLLRQMTSDDVTFWRPFADYVAQSRINMNVRQVLAAGQTSLS
ncbi:hypothetical protein LSTR_LSTR003529, partial [Laodelphax striatellus]